MSDLVGNPEDRFSRVAAQMIFYISLQSSSAEEEKEDVIQVKMNKPHHEKTNLLHI